MNTEKKKTKVDLVTGFLGAGKTTFIKKYARYLLDKGCKIGVLENDFGAQPDGSYASFAGAFGRELRP